MWSTKETARVLTVTYTTTLFFRLNCRIIMQYQNFKCTVMKLPRVF